MPRLKMPHDRPPIFIGAGIVKEKGQLERLVGDDNLAAVVAGSYTDSEWPGNSNDGRKNVEYWDAGNRAYYNCVDLSNPGRKNASSYLPGSLKALKDSGMLALISVTSLKHENPALVLPDMAEWALEMGADGVEINGSCPNHNPDEPLLCFDVNATQTVYSAIRERTGSTAILGYKVSPLPADSITAYGTARMGWDFYDATNTKGNQMSPINPSTGMPYIEVNDGLAGMSGPAIAYESRENLQDWTNALADSADVLSMGGVDSLYTHHYEIYSRVHLYGALMVGGAQEFRRASDVRTVVARWAQNYVSALDTFDQGR